MSSEERSSMKELDGWVEQLMECKQLTENQVSTRANLVCGAAFEPLKATCDEKLLFQGSCKAAVLQLHCSKACSTVVLQDIGERGDCKCSTSQKYI